MWRRCLQRCSAWGARDHRERPASENTCAVLPLHSCPRCLLLPTAGVHPPHGSRQCPSRGSSSLHGETSYSEP